MSNKAIVILLSLALGLSGLIWYMNWRSGPAPAQAASQAQPVAAPIPAADVVSIGVRTGPAEELVRREAAGGWVYAKLAGAESAAWPVDPTPVQNLLRLISELRPGDVSDRGAKLPDGAVIVTLTMKDGVSRTVRIGTSPVAGRTMVEVDSRPAFPADAAILSAATQPSPRGWRVTRAIPGGADAELSRIAITTPDAPLALSRIDNRWAIDRPISARANPQAVANLLDAVARISIEKFIDDAPPGGTPAGVLASPRMIIACERDTRSVDEQGQLRSGTWRRGLFIGGPADAAGTLLYASPDANGSQLFLVSASSVAAVATLPRAYVALTASGASPGDVGMLSVRAGKSETAYRRVAGSWVKLVTGGKQDKSLPDRHQIEEAIDLFTSRAGQPDAVLARADTVASAPPDASGAIRPLVDVRLMSDDGTPLDELTMGYTADGTLAAKVRDVVLTYPNTPAPRLLHMPEFKSLPPAPGATGSKRAAKPTSPPKK